MLYTRRVVDLDTGELRWVALGDHVTLTEAAASLGMGPRAFRKALLHLEILHKEFDPVAQQHRSRLSPGAVQSGFGMRHDKSGLVGETDRQPFDVLSPLGLDFIREKLPAAVAAVNSFPRAAEDAGQALAAFEKSRLAKLTTEMRAAWLADHFPSLTMIQTAAVLGVSRQMVERYLERRRWQLEEAWRLRMAPLAAHAGHPGGTLEGTL